MDQGLGTADEYLEDVPRGNSSSAPDLVSGEPAGFEASEESVRIPSPRHAVSGKERYCRKAQ